MQCTALPIFCTAVQWSFLQCVALQYTAVHSTKHFGHVLHYIELHNMLVTQIIEEALLSLPCTALHTAYCTALCNSIGSALYCTTLHCIVLHYTTLHCNALHRTALYCTTPHCIVLHYTTLHCIVLYCTVLYNVLYCTVLYCTMYCTVLYCIVQCIVDP